MDAVSKDAPLYSILGKVASGIYILTARHGDEETGMLASWVMQADFNPPVLTVAVQRKRYLADWLSEGTVFALNVVDEHEYIATFIAERFRHRQASQRYAKPVARRLIHLPVYKRYLIDYA